MNERSQLEIFNKNQEDSGNMLMNLFASFNDLESQKYTGLQPIEILSQNIINEMK